MAKKQTWEGGLHTATLENQGVSRTSAVDSALKTVTKAESVREGEEKTGAKLQKTHRICNRPGLQLGT